MENNNLNDAIIKPINNVNMLNLHQNTEKNNTYEYQNNIDNIQKQYNTNHHNNYNNQQLQYGVQPSFINYPHQNQYNNNNNNQIQQNTQHQQTFIKKSYTYNPNNTYKNNPNYNTYNYDPKNVIKDVIEDNNNQNRMVKINITEVFAACVLGEHAHTPDAHKNMINAATNLSGGISHTELVFLLENGEYACCTIHYGEEVEFLTKTYTGKEKWRLYRIDVNSEQASKIYDFCVEQEGKKFDKIGLWTGFIPGVNYFTNILKWAWYGPEERWFCSGLVLRALQEASEEFKHYDPRYTSPTELNKILIKHGKFVVDVFNKELYNKKLKLFDPTNMTGNPNNV
jgi:hypothetical protein